MNRVQARGWASRHNHVCVSPLVVGDFWNLWMGRVFQKSHVLRCFSRDLGIPVERPRQLVSVWQYQEPSSEHAVLSSQYIQRIFIRRSLPEVVNAAPSPRCWTKADADQGSPLDFLPQGALHEPQQGVPCPPPHREGLAGSGLEGRLRLH